MRPIKFRVWNGEMFHSVGELVFMDGGIRWFGPGVGCGWCELDEVFWEKNKTSTKPSKIDTLEQFTGLTDKNGKEIYEGDILDEEWAVGWFDGHFVLCNPIDEAPEKAAKEVFGVREVKISIVTGNIHQNPELLEANP